MISEIRLVDGVHRLNQGLQVMRRTPPSGEEPTRSIKAGNFGTSNKWSAPAAEAALEHSGAVVSVRLHLQLKKYFETHRSMQRADLARSLQEFAIRQTTL